MEYSEPPSFNDGFALVSNSSQAWVTDDVGRTKIHADTNYSLVDRNGSRSIGSQWRSASSFSQGLAPVMVGDAPEGNYAGESLSWIYLPVTFTLPACCKARPGEDEERAIFTR